MSVLWLVVQLFFWCALLVVTVEMAVLSILAPPFVAYKLIRHYY